MDVPTGQNAGPIDVRAALLEAIGCRKSGVSRYELSRKIYEIGGLQTLFSYEDALAKLVEDGLVYISYCGLDNHRIQVYSLCSQKECRVCHLVKSIVLFRKRCDSKDGRNSQCKTCENMQRKTRGWANKSRKRRQEQRDRERGLVESVPSQSRGIPTAEELAASTAEVKSESLEAHRLKFRGKNFVVVDGQVVPAKELGVNPVDEYDRAWRRIRTKPIRGFPPAETL